MNDISMLPEENFLNHNFQLYKIGLDQKTLNLIEALLMELSLVSNQSALNDSFARNKHSNVGLMEGMMKVLEWKLKGNINDGEFSMLYVEWLRSKQYIVKDHLISFSYDFLVPKNSIINYLRNQQHQDLAFVVSQYMELLNSQFNEQLSTIAKIPSRQIEVSEDIYIMFDDEGIGYIGMDQTLFLYMVLVKKQRLNLPYSKNQFYQEFNNFVSLIPQINGNISLRSLKTYLILSSVSSEDISEILEGCKELLTEFGWNQFNQQESSDNQFVFPKPFNEAFVECMNALHQQGYVNDEDLMRDEFLNTYNIFLNEEYYKIIGQLTNHTSYLNCQDQTKLQRALFSDSLEYYNERVLQGLNIKISQMVFNAFVIKFDQKIQQYITQFMNKYAPSTYQSYQSHDSKQDLNQQRGSKIFQKSRQSKPSLDSKGDMQRFEKENYKPKINFMEDSVYSNNNNHNNQNNYHSWNESSVYQNDTQNRSNLPFFQASVQQTQPSRSSIRDSSYLDNLQSNINKNIKNGNNGYLMGKGAQYMQTNQPQMQSQKQQLFQQFSSQNRIAEQREQYPIEYNVKLTDLDKSSNNKLGANNQQNKNLRNRSKSPIQLNQIDNQNGITYSNSRISTPSQKKQNNFQIISKPPLDGRQNLRYSSQSFNVQDNRQQQNSLNRQKNGQNTHSSNNIRQVTPTKSISPIKFHITLSNQQKQQSNQQKPYINEFQAFQPSQGISFQKQTTSSKQKKINQGSSVKKAKSFMNMRANSVENVNHFNSDIQLRQQTSMGFREQTPDKQFQTTNNNWNENSNLKNRKHSQASNNYMQQSLNSFQNQSTAAMQRSKSPQVRKSQNMQMWNKRVEPFEKVMQRLTSQQGVSPMKEFKKKPFH